jgi:hypothetical protein
VPRAHAMPRVGGGLSQRAHVVLRFRSGFATLIRDPRLWQNMSGMRPRSLRRVDRPGDASGAYEEALSEFTRLKSSLTAPGAAVEADQYRAFCLVALGRTTEAEGLAESLVRKDPMMTVGRLDASPRIEAMFATLRKRVLPQVIRDEYRIARSLASQKSPDAQSHLRDLQRMLTEAESIGAWDETLSDLRILVDGFLELSHAAASNSPPLVGAVVERADAKPSDTLMVVAARTWKYRPATLNGVPVPFVKSIVVNAEPSR